MKNFFVPYHIALKLKQLNFDQNCFGHYEISGILHNTPYYKNVYALAPTYQQVTDWFRENYKIHIEIISQLLPKNNYKYIYKIGSNVENMKDGFDDYYKCYTEAIETALTLI